MEEQTYRAACVGVSRLSLIEQSAFIAARLLNEFSDVWIRWIEQQNKRANGSTGLLLDRSVLRIISSACKSNKAWYGRKPLWQFLEWKMDLMATAVFNQRRAEPAGDPSGRRTAAGPKFKRVISAPFPPKQKSQLISPTVTWPITSKP